MQRTDKAAASSDPQGRAVVPLQRTLANPQGGVPSELWNRSLRQNHLHIAKVGLHNQNVTTSTVAVMFNPEGRGWTGKTNSRPPGGRKIKQPGPHMKEWVEKPVAVGKMALDHMGGSRYNMDLTPRPCVPNSMMHLTAGSLGPTVPHLSYESGTHASNNKSGAMTAR